MADRDVVIRRARSAGKFITGEDIRDLGEDSEPARGSGWVSYHDSVKTSASPLALDGGTRTQITIDGLGSRTDTTYADGISHSVWSGNRLMGETLGETFIVRLGFSLKTTVDMFSGITGLISALLTSVLRADVEKENTVKIEIDFGVFAVTKTLAAPRKMGDTANITELFFIHTGAQVISPGGSIYLTSKYDSDVWDVDLAIQRIYSP